MRATLFILMFVLACASGQTAPLWRLSLPGWQYQFPRDHFAHPEFKTEWWYFTDNLRDEGGRRFGYQLTFFRQGIRPPGARKINGYRFICDELKFAHFAISDPKDGKFRYLQKMSRGAFGEAGFAVGDRLAWIDDWNLQLIEGGMRLAAKSPGASLSLDLKPQKPWIVHGENGVSQKAAGEGRATHYYSGTRLRSTGELTIEGRKSQVEGSSWFDQEWGSNQLTPEQVGWNWFALQFDDGTELMLYQMRLRDGAGVDPNSSGTFVAADGTARHLRVDEYKLTPRRWWTSKATGGKYPIGWEVEVPSLDLRFEVSTPLEKQELEISPIAYWEGMIDAKGIKAGKAVRGEGYLELTGYAGALVGLAQ
jgi:predicted secreted hydrolase